MAKFIDIKNVFKKKLQKRCKLHNRTIYFSNLYLNELLQMFFSHSITSNAEKTETMFLHKEKLTFFILLVLFQVSLI